MEEREPISIQSAQAPCSAHSARRAWDGRELEKCVRNEDTQTMRSVAVPRPPDEVERAVVEVALPAVVVVHSINDLLRVLRYLPDRTADHVTGLLRLDLDPGVPEDANRACHRIAGTDKPQHSHSTITVTVTVTVTVTEGEPAMRSDRRHRPASDQHSISVGWSIPPHGA